MSETKVEKYVRLSVEFFREKDETRHDAIGDELDSLWWSMTDAEHDEYNKVCLEDSKKASA